MSRTVAAGTQVSTVDADGLPEGGPRTGESGSDADSVGSALGGPERLSSGPTSVLGLLAGMTGAGLVVAVSVLAAAGAFAPAPLGVVDPGLLVQVGLPVARTLHDLAAALTVGLLVLSVWLVAPQPGSSPTRLDGPRLATLRAASVAAGAWLLSAFTVLTFTAAELAGQPLTSPGSWENLRAFVFEVDLGRALGTSVLMVAAVAVVTVASTRIAAAGWAAGLGLLALMPLALTGHSAGSADHANASTSLALHLVGVVLWVGGLGALVLMARRLGPQLPAVVRRYSTLAGWCFAVVALSGVLSAVLRIESLANAVSLYGLLALGKMAALVLLGLAGWRHRVAVIPRLGGSRGRLAFLRLATVELLVMGAAMGLAVALSRSPVAGGGHGGGGAAAPLPPASTLTNYLTQLSVDLLWLAVAGAGLTWYLWSIRTLSRQGGRWPAHRTALWVAGCLALGWVTSGGPAAYAPLSFSGHMLQHLSLTFAVPLLLVLGAPVTLALRTLPSRADHSLGVRETLIMVLESRIVSMLRDPMTAAGLLVGGLIAFYYLPGTFELALSTHTGHVLMTVYFLAAGCLLVSVLVGGNPARTAATPPVQTRLMALASTGVLLGMVGVGLQRSSSPLAYRWWERIGRLDVAGMLENQQAGASMAWMLGGALVLFAGLALLTTRAQARRGAGPTADTPSTPTARSKYASTVANGEACLPRAQGEAAELVVAGCFHGRGRFSESSRAGAHPRAATPLHPEQVGPGVSGRSPWWSRCRCRPRSGS